MAAAGAAAARRESVPARTAAIFEEFRIVTGRAKPAVRRFRLPFAQRAADAAEIRTGRFPLEVFLNIGV